MEETGVQIKLSETAKLNLSLQGQVGISIKKASKKEGSEDWEPRHQHAVWCGRGHARTGRHQARPRTWAGASLIRNGSRTKQDKEHVC